MKIFFDFEFTGLHQNTTPISFGCVAENGEQFYAEFKDYDRSQIDDWVQENVINHLFLVSTSEQLPTMTTDKTGRTIIGERWQVARFFWDWVRRFDGVEMWSDVLAYDWVLFCEITKADGNYFPDNVYYIPFDIATLMKIKGVDPDVSREAFSGIENLTKHNSLDDARIIKACYEKLMEMP